MFAAIDKALVGRIRKKLGARRVPYTLDYAGTREALKRARVAPDVVLINHDVRLPRTGLAPRDAARATDHLLAIDHPIDIAEAVRGLNGALKRGARGGEQLARAQERALWAMRGLTPGAAPGFTAAELAALRAIADDHAPARAGRVLRRAMAASPTAAGAERALLRQLATDAGLVLPRRGGPDGAALDALLRELRTEGHHTRGPLLAGMNRAIAAGEASAAAIRLAGDRALLADLGLSPAVADRLGARPAAALRDMLHVATPATRARAIATLGNLPAGASAPAIERALAPVWAGAITRDVGDATLARALRAGLTPYEQASLATGLAALPAEVRRAVFAPHAGRAPSAAKVAERLTARIEAFGVRVHRTPGAFPDRRGGPAEQVKDWAVRDLVDLHGALARMAGDRGLPAGVRGTTLVRAGDVGAQAMAIADGRGRDIVTIADGAWTQASREEARGIPGAVGTIIHELGHALQLGGPRGKAASVRFAAERKLRGAWSAIAGWRDAFGQAPTGYRGGKSVFGDPGARVAAPKQLNSHYAATDPTEDFAEFFRIFYTDRALAKRLSPRKFAHVERLVGGSPRP